MQLHANFLALCKKYSVPKEALPILDYPGYFKHASKTAVSQFLINGCDLLITLKKYNEAIELIDRGFQIEFLDHEIEMALVKRQIVLSIALG